MAAVEVGADDDAGHCSGGMIIPQIEGSTQTSWS